MVTGRHLTVDDILAERSRCEGEREAFRFVRTDGAAPAILTYRRLHCEANAIARMLRCQVAPGDRVLLLHPPGLAFVSAFFACLRANVIAIPYYPPKRPADLQRLSALVAEAEPVAALSTTPESNRIARLFTTVADLGTLPVMSTDQSFEDGQDAEDSGPIADRLAIAYLQYTSGSTGTPKGVIVTHESLLANLSGIRRAFEHVAGTRAVIWLPPYHDMGLVGGILEPVFAGFPCTLMAPATFVRDPLVWLRTISETRATDSGAPNSAFEFCVRRVTPEQREGLDLSNWSLAFVGSEPVHASTLDAFAKFFEPCGFRARAFYPCYGLAESTLLVTGGRRGSGSVYAAVMSEALAAGRVELASPQDGGVRRLVGCGSALPGHVVRIVDPETGNSLPDGVAGEIWAAGPSVSQGYWRKPAETRRRFQNHLPGSEGPMMRTGDLGFLLNGELFVIGRRDDVIVIRGRNFFPDDLERIAGESHPALQPGSAMAFMIPDGDEQVLAIAVEWERSCQDTARVPEAAESIRRAISEEYQLRVEKVLLAAPGSLPRCANGKPQRSQCRRMFLDGRIGEARGPLPGYGARKVDRSSTLVAWLREYARSRINSQLMRERRCIPPHVVLDFGNQGLLGLQVPEALGGIGMNSAGVVQVLEQLAAIDLTLGAFVGVHNALGIRPILNYAPESLRSAILPDIARGRELVAFAVTESGAGSNPQAITSTATPLAPGVWSLRGRKIWIGTGSWAGTVNVFTQLLDEEGRRLGITGFVARHDDAGFRSGPEALTMGMRAMVQNEILLEGVVLDRGRMLGQPGNGMQVAQDAMMFGRFGLAALSLGGMKRCAQLMFRYARRRRVSAGLLLETPAAVERLTRLTASIGALEMLVHMLAALLDSGRTAPPEAFLACKILGPEFLWHAADDLMQMLGGRGYIEPNLVPGILEDARLFRIFEGPTEALCEHLGAQAIHHSESLQRFLSETLGSPATWTELNGAAQDLWGRRSGSAAWAHYVAGQLAAFAILDACARKGADSGGRAAAWTRIRFDEILRYARESSPSHAELDPAGLPDTIEAYGEAIGDVEQGLPGVDYALDPMLRKDETPEEKESPACEEYKAGGTNVGGWIRNWMANRVGVRAGNVDPAKPLTAYGIDSLLALELAGDLSKFAGVPLPDNVVFAYPTIAELEAFLTDELKRRPAAVPS